MQKTRPKVGISILIIHNEHLLLGKRLGNLGLKTYATPGGHLEYNETFEDCAKREALEETGLTLGPLEFAGITNDRFPHAHYVSIFMKAKFPEGQIIQTLEPDKIAHWDWYNQDALPKPLFLSLENWLNDEAYAKAGSKNPA